MSARLALASLALSLGTLAGCGGSPTPPPPAVLALIDQMQKAPIQVPYAGLRRIEITGPLAHIDLAYTERVWNDGTGRFAILPEDVLTPLDMNAVEFELMQRARAGYFYRYRDFTIRDVDLFLSNYEVQDYGEQVTVAGRPAWELTFHRSSEPGAGYRVAADPATGLVLRYVELDASGAEVSSMEYVSIDYAPSFEGVAWHRTTLNEEPLDLDAGPAALIAQLGFLPLVPKDLPAGYQPEAVTKMVDPDDRVWAKVYATDGIDALFFLSTSRSPFGTSLGTFGDGSDEVVWFRAGPVTVAQGKVHDYEVLTVGRVSELELTWMIDSSLP